MTLARSLAAHSHAAAFAAYGAERITRANRCVLAAERNREIFHSDRLMDAGDASRYVSAQWNEAKMRERYHWLFAFDAVGAS